MPDPCSLGPQRLSLPRGASREDRIARSRECLHHALTLRTTVAFVGAGCSAPLGYPRWNVMVLDLIRTTLAVVRRHPSNLKHWFEVGTLEDFEHRLDQGERAKAAQLMFALGLCQNLAEELRRRDSKVDDFIGEYFREAFKPRAASSKKPPNPDHALLRLPIQRFVTTNYDAEIERALEEVRDVPRDEPGKSFTQLPKSIDQLALFALSKISEIKDTVFHCHGRYDEPDSIVASEADYQRWYLGDREGAPGFRRTIELLLGSNPILFVGYGLQDEDLLQPLRLFAATDAMRKEAGSVFALMPEDGDGRSVAYHESLRERFGVQVIPFARPSSDAPEAWGEVWVRELERLQEESVVWRESWISKPYIRRVEVGVKPPQAYRHYSFQESEAIVLGRATVDKKLGEIEEKIFAGARVVTLAGRGGTGKSWHAMRLLERLRKKSGRFAGYFFWSSYYADDALTGLDRMLAYLEKPGEKADGNRLDRLIVCLARGRYLLVLDGIERLLWETDRPEVGEPSSAHVRELLDVIASRKSESCVVLTTRLLPEPYFGDAKPEHVEVVPLERMTYDDVHRVPPFASIQDKRATHALCSLLDGHAYALVLAAGYLGTGSPREALRKLLHRLSGTPPDRRVSRMIKEAIRALEADESRLAKEFLQHLAVFMSPVTEKAARHCYDLAVAAWGTKRRPADPPPRREALVAALMARHLLFAVEDGESGKAYTVHPTVRSFLFDSEYNAPSDPLPNFTLAGFTSGTAVLHPGTEIERELENLGEPPELSRVSRRGTM